MITAVLPLAQKSTTWWYWDT